LSIATTPEHHKRAAKLVAETVAQINDEMDFTPL